MSRLPALNTTVLTTIKEAGHPGGLLGLTVPVAVCLSVCCRLDACDLWWRKKTLRARPSVRMRLELTPASVSHPKQHASLPLH